MNALLQGLHLSVCWYSALTCRQYAAVSGGQLQAALSNSPRVSPSSTPNPPLALKLTLRLRCSPSLCLPALWGHPATTQKATRALQGRSQKARRVFPGKRQKAALAFTEGAQIGSLPSIALPRYLHPTPPLGHSPLALMFCWQPLSLLELRCLSCRSWMDSEAELGTPQPETGNATCTPLPRDPTHAAHLSRESS